MAIEHQVPIVPMAVLGIEDMFNIRVDADDIAKSPAIPLLRKLGLLSQDKKSKGEAFRPPLSTGAGPAGLLRPERIYVALGEPIMTTDYKGFHEDRDACFAVREQVRAAILRQLGELRALRDDDPGRYPSGRMLGHMRDLLSCYRARESTTQHRLSGTLKTCQKTATANPAKRKLENW
jgi:1-acyl-sn-glycerol-3-phosphate acyltransferase